MTALLVDATKPKSTLREAACSVLKLRHEK